MIKNKKNYTFIPTTQRLLAIIQLCLAFSLILWYATQPFMGEYFQVKSRMLLYEYVLGTSNQPSQKDKLVRNSERFNLLSDAEKKELINDYEQLSHYSMRSTSVKILDGIKTLILYIPPFELAWIVSATLLSILILLKYEGAKQAAWLLPLITLVYAINNQWLGHLPQPTPDEELIPSEQEIIRDYIKEPFPTTIQEQQNALQEGWNNYLVDKWSSKMNLKKEELIEEGEFNFTLARIKKLSSQPYSQLSTSFNQKASPVLLVLYLLWNIFFAWKMNKPLQKLIVSKIKN